LPNGLFRGISRVKRPKFHFRTTYLSVSALEELLRRKIARRVARRPSARGFALGQSAAGGVSAAHRRVSAPEELPARPGASVSGTKKLPERLNRRSVASGSFERASSFGRSARVGLRAR